jgi:hypothetical protein
MMPGRNAQLYKVAKLLADITTSGIHYCLAQSQPAVAIVKVCPAQSDCSMPSDVTSK